MVSSAVVMRAPKTREQRAGIVEQTGLAGVDREMQAFLVGILHAYTAHGEDELSLTKLAAFLTARYGSITDAKKRLGEPSVVRAAFINLPVAHRRPRFRRPSSFTWAS
ncbi:MAG: hypothetical protein ABI216_15985 [Devosia sp.]